MKPISIRWHSDPGHGWLAVKIKEVENLGILDKITRFSYVKGATIYLEEDCDASRFLREVRERGIPVKELQPSSNDKSSPIRSYPRFSPPA